MWLVLTGSILRIIQALAKINSSGHIEKIVLSLLIFSCLFAVIGILIKKPFLLLVHLCFSVILVIISIVLKLETSSVALSGILFSCILIWMAYKELKRQIKQIENT